VRTLSREELEEAFLVRAELESLATELAAARITPADLEELRTAEARFAELTERLTGGRTAELDERRALTAEWVRANHAFHDVIYRVAAAPMVERIAKSARRTFAGQAVWGAGASDIDELYERNVLQHRAIREALAAGSGAGARALAREHVLHSFRLLETVLAQIGQPALRRLA
jgi:DNA-binding GntR family transcriptional regulator